MPFTKEYWEQQRIERGLLPGQKLPTGRPAGVKNKLTLLKEKQRDKFDKSIALMSRKLTNVQAIVALGTHKMVRMFKGSDDKMHVETIRDEKRMQNLLDTGIYGVDYVIVVGEMPEWKAANALLDRTFGKASETIKVSGEVQFSLKLLAVQRKEIADESIKIPNEVMENEQNK